MPKQYLRHSGIINPFKEPFTLPDIADALALISRFQGQTRFYSVLEHTWLVYLLVPETHRLSALLHDAPEAFIGDINGQWKSPVDHSRDDLMMSRIQELFNLPPLLDVHEWDRTALAIEMGVLFRKPHNEHADTICPGWRAFLPLRAKAAKLAASPARWCTAVEELARA